MDLQTVYDSQAGMTDTSSLPEEESFVFPLSFEQQRLWFLDQLEPNNPFYNIPAALLLRGSLDLVALGRSLQEIVRRHEVLRTSFTVIEEQPVQVIAPSLTVPVTLIDLQGFPETEREAKVRQLATKEAQCPFDLSQGPLLRSTVLRLSAEEHVLLITLHHIVADGWSAVVLIKELAALYTAYVTGQANSLPELPIQYADYVIWQQEWLSGEALAQQLTYWKEQLASAPPLLELPTDHPRPAVQTFHGATLTLALPATLSHQLRTLSQHHGTTLFMTLLAAFQLLLARYSGQSDILVGSPAANRSRPELEGLIGLFANTLVLRTDLSGNPSFAELLTRVRHNCLDAYSHQETPFEKLVEALHPQRDLSRSPLFQVFFLLQTMPLPSVHLPGLSLSALPLESGIAKFDLTLAFTPGPQGLEASMEYNSDLFDTSTIQRLLAHLQHLLTSIVAHPQQPLSQLSMLSAAEHHLLLHEWGAGPQQDVPEGGVHRGIEAQVRRCPQQTALIYGQQHLSYQQLNQRANQLAHYLQAVGVGPEQRVALYLERSVEMVLAVLAVLKAGGVYMPLDPGTPAARLAYLLADAQPAVLLTQQRLVARLPAYEGRVVQLDQVQPEWAEQSSENLSCEVLPQQLAYLLYTSGSTGTPKGVMISHQGLANYLAWSSKAYQVNQGSGAPLLSSLAFDLTVTSFFLPLLCGKAVTLIAEDDMSASSLRAALVKGGFSLVKLTPAHLEVLSQWLPAKEAAGMTRRLVVGGEALAGESLSHWRTHAPQTHVVNEYGPTETVVGCSVFECAASEVASGSIAIGRPIANMCLYVLDQWMQPVAQGLAGELYIAGPGLARGYLGRAELTAERFLPNPFSTEPGSRLYKSGDLVHYRADGNLEFVGRLDSQVKLRGYRIELGEIEAVLREHAQVQEAVVLLREDLPGDKRLVAYMVGKTAHRQIEEVQAFLRTRLPDYMLPAAFVFLEQLPLTPNGKIDRQALPAPSDNKRPELSTGYVAPRTPLEEEIARAFTEVLGIDKVGVHDNFFDLGAHSLRVAQLATRLSRNYQIKLSVAQFFEVPTVAGIARTIEVYSEAAVTTTNMPDLEAEAVLDPTISPEGLPLANITNPSNILLTGVTGFLGAFLLKELLQETQANLFCLVRGADPEDGRKRIESFLRSLQIWDDSFNARVIPVVGDLGKPLLGLSEAQFMELAATIDVIYHSGAMVNFIYPYSVLKATNVLGTQDILRLACKVRVKAVHYVSALDVFVSRIHEDRTVREEETVHPGGNRLGYVQSKWVAERLVTLAKYRGLPTCIFRPWLITGHSETGVTHTTDYTCVALKGCIQLGCVPDHELRVNVMPVDFVSRGLVYLSRQESSLGRIFHFANQHLAHIREAYEWIRSFGYPLNLLPYSTWYKRVLNVDQSSALYSVMPIIAQTEEPYPDIVIDCSNTLEALAGTGIVCPPVNESHVRLCLSYLVNVGFLDAPHGYDGAQQSRAGTKVASTAHTARIF